MFKLMKNIFFIILLSISTEGFSQYYSYSEYKYETMLTFETFFEVVKDTDKPLNYIISAKEDFQLVERMGPFDNVAPILENAFESADCKPCIQVSEKLTEKPIHYIFDIIEYQDVFLVTKFENKYKVVRYQAKEED